MDADLTSANTASDTVSWPHRLGVWGAELVVFEFMRAVRPKFRGCPEFCVNGAGIQTKVEHPFRVIKRQFGYTKVCYRGLKKNTAQIVTLFALSNLWMARRKMMGSTG